MLVIEQIAYIVCHLCDTSKLQGKVYAPWSIVDDLRSKIPAVSKSARRTEGTDDEMLVQFCIRCVGIHADGTRPCVSTTELSALALLGVRLMMAEAHRQYAAYAQSLGEATKVPFGYTPINSPAVGHVDAPIHAEKRVTLETTKALEMALAQKMPSAWSPD